MRSNRASIGIKFLWALLVVELAFIFFVLLNHYFAWISNENDTIHAWVYKNGKAWRWEDWLRFLDNEVIEGYADRVSRPINDFFHIVNAKFRAFCWDYMPPHPSLSMIWPLCFTIVPICLYKFFRNMGCYAIVALTGVIFYLGSIGFLSSIVMYIHPAKMLANIGAVLVLYWGSRIYKLGLDSSKAFTAQWLIFLSLIFITFLSDETGLFVYVLGFFVVSTTLFTHKNKVLLWISFLMLPVLYFVTVRGVLPFLHFCYTQQVVDVRQYSQYPNFSMLLHAPWWKTYATNLMLFLHDNPHLQLNTANLLPYNKPLYFLGVAYTVIAIGVAIVFLKTLFNNTKQGLLIVVGLMGVALCYVFFHTLLMSSVWGNWYYGAHFSLIYFIWLCFIFQYILQNNKSVLVKMLFPIVVLLFALHNLAFTFYRVDIFDTNKSVWTHRYSVEDVFLGKTPDYFKDFSLLDGIKKSDCRYWYTVLEWSKIKGKEIKPHVLERVQQCQSTLQEDKAFFVGQPYWRVEL